MLQLRAVYGWWLLVNKAKLIAVSSMCAAVVFGCLMLATLPGLRWMALVLGVIASIATVIPMMINIKNVVFSLLTYLVGSILGVFFGIANIVYVAPLVCFSIPFAMVKVFGETVNVTATVDKQQVLEDPFGNGDDRTLVQVKVSSNTKLKKFVKWLLYYILLEACLGLTLLATFLFTKPVFETIVSAKWFWWAVVAIQLIVYPYDFLMTGCLAATSKLLRKVVKPQ